MLLRRKGFGMNHKRIYGLYKAQGLALRRKARKRLSNAPRVAAETPAGPNQRWSMDFVSDVTMQGRRFRVLTVVDDFTREALATVVETSISGLRVARELERLVLFRGAPTAIVTDNGPEFTSRALDAWCHERGVRHHFIRPGKPVENAFIESFNGRLRDECLDVHWFSAIEQARTEIEEWRCDYNEQRPHSSLDNLTPNEYVAKYHQGLSQEVAQRSGAPQGALHFSTPPRAGRARSEAKNAAES